MTEKYIHVTALESFQVPHKKAFQKGAEYAILEEEAKELLSRGLVEITVIQVKDLEEETIEDKKSSKRAAK